ncbi:DUF298-domain-containing protein [Flagelloscypha sp. PMI_526]|nr:DUF298-domain-containing protein [Flagelloscypha sp. PMI_526]
MVPMVVDEEKPAPPPPPAKIEPPKPKNTKKPEPYSASTALALFQQYADPDDPSVIGPEGMERMCTDAGIPMDGALPIILAWQVNAKELGKFEKQGWIDGMAKHKISNFTALQTLLTDLEDLLLHQKPAVRAPSGKNSEVYDRTVYRSYADNVEDAFKKFYSFGFALAKPEQSKNIDMETASALWTVMLVPRYRLMGDIVNYINDKGTYRAANKDLWAMMLEFVSTVDPDLKDYTTSEEDSWPTLIDEFVEWKKAQ